jgi:hypothetical protein
MRSYLEQSFYHFGDEGIHGAPPRQIATEQDSLLQDVLRRLDRSGERTRRVSWFGGVTGAVPPLSQLLAAAWDRAASWATAVWTGAGAPPLDRADGGVGGGPSAARDGELPRVVRFAPARPAQMRAGAPVTAAATAAAAAAAADGAAPVGRGVDGGGEHAVGGAAWLRLNALARRKHAQLAAAAQRVERAEAALAALELGRRAPGPGQTAGNDGVVDGIDGAGVQQVADVALPLVAVPPWAPVRSRRDGGRRAKPEADSIVDALERVLALARAR